MRLKGVLPVAIIGLWLPVPARALTVCLDPDYLPYRPNPSPPREAKAVAEREELFACTGTTS